VITGSSKAGTMIVTHPDIDKIAFTGSTDVGRILRQQTAGSGKKLSLELVANHPSWFSKTPTWTAPSRGWWMRSGSTRGRCCAGSRLLVQENIADRFIAKLKQRMGHMRVGDPLDKCIDMGAIVDQTQWDTIDRWVKRGAEEGGQVFQPDIELPQKGLFYPP
jgi:aldehyde dehydrogenase (NAD+)